MRPKVVDLFCGVGGFSLGFEQAGFVVVVAVDSDPIHCATHADNFPCTELLAGDTVILPSPPVPESPYARSLRCSTDADWYDGHRREWDPRLLASSARTRHTKESRERFAATEPGTIEPVSRFYRLHPDRPANTLRAGTDASRGSYTSPRPIHYACARCVTVREMARLHGFPDWFRFHPTKWHGARQVGNAVCPPVARAIALEIRKVATGTGRAGRP